MDINIDVTNLKLETDRLILRQWNQTDLDDFYEYASVKGVIKFLFDDIKLDAVTICHLVYNNQSKRVIEKCEFKFENKKLFYYESLNSYFEEMQYILYNNEKVVK